MELMELFEFDGKRAFMQNCEAYKQEGSFIAYTYIEGELFLKLKNLQGSAKDRVLRFVERDIKKLLKQGRLLMVCRYLEEGGTMQYETPGNSLPRFWARKR